MKNGWIWLPSEQYPNEQTTYYNGLDRFIPDQKYTVCALKKKYNLGARAKINIEVSADTAFLLLCNEKSVLRGPAYSGGDFLDNDKPRKDYYSFKAEFSTVAECIELYALVRLTPYHICEYSRGQGGFFLRGTAELENGEKITLQSDESWEVSRLNSYTYPTLFDASIENDAFLPAEVKGDIWQAKVAPIPPCTLSDAKVHKFSLGAKEHIKTRIEYERVFAAYLKCFSHAKVGIALHSFELEKITKEYYLTVDENMPYYSLELLSTGGFEIEITNLTNEACEVKIVFEESYFPISTQAKTVVSDRELTELLDICAHTLKYCRQNHHLDSPLHCEPLACVGDYYIEMLMNAFAYGDTSLTEFDLERIAFTMENRDGRLFHTTYSLIFIKMVYECYMLSGNIDVLHKTKRALDLLLARFEAYIGENGLIETPPDYMFIDWLCPDGISTHHPPKALGQSCLCIYYYGGLISAARIYDVLGDKDEKVRCLDKAEAMKKAIFEHLFDTGRGLFFEGLNTETPSELLYQYMPKNVEKRYYRRHANILACYFGLVSGDEARLLLDRIYSLDELGEVQPYFMHFWLDAVYLNGLREKYTLSLLDGWKKAMKISKKGLPEGFYPPEPTYKFDYSHAWGGTPLYALPKALLGLEILECGFKKIKLNPCLLSLDFASVEIPTPYGKVKIELTKGQAPKISAPSEVEIVY